MNKEEMSAVFAAILVNGIQRQLYDSAIER